ncbi:MAG: aminotransferase class V-fold PLP-dependent enzyme, partial [Clostridia bacterium]|nr:aminotransferase class V-fold PLP-dependent enzyme [Clostridia bacterium]
MIYLDNAATTYYKPQEVKQAVNTAMNLYTANAGRGAHRLAQLSAEQIFETRQKVLNLFNAYNHTCIFTSGCTSALNLAIQGSVKLGGHIITTYLEHNSVLRPLEYLKLVGKIDYTAVNNIDINSIEQAIKPNTYMIITTQASNVTGERPNIKSINKLCKKYNLIHLVDTAQGAGHIFEDLSYVDMIAFAGHEGLYGIGGVGGLVVKNDIQLQPILYGGTGTASESLIQPNIAPEGFEAGTLANIPIISLGAGIDYVTKNKNYIIAKEEKLNKAMKSMLNNLNFI